MKHAIIGIVLLLAVARGAAEQRNTCPKGAHTLYSNRATSLDSGLERIKSPDGSKLLTVRRVEDAKDPDGMHLAFTLVEGKKKFRARLLGFNAEVLWSPDSSAFAVTQTEGGGGIGYGAYVFYVRQHGLEKVALSPPIKKAFSNPAKCEIESNVAIVDWLHESDRILVVGETIPVSFCQCMGTFELYDVSVPDGRVLQKYSQIEGKNKYWNLLGCELRDADDSCSKNISRHRKRG